MDFTHFLSAYMPDPSYGGKRLYSDMIEQAVLADRLGYRGVAVPEHHLINLLMVPSPLQFAVKVAAVTRHVDLITSICVLPVRDMRVFAGEVVQADMLCDERLIVGCGRGAFRYEIERLGTPMEITSDKFRESLAVLEALLEGEEVSWHGKYYIFEPLTVMPRPTRKIPIMIAAMAPDAIYHSAKRGYDIQTTPLSGDHDVLRQQVDSFRRGKADGGAQARNNRLALQRGVYAARDDAEARQIIGYAYEYYKRFENIRGPGVVSHGIIEALPRKQTIEELAQNLIICTPAEVVDRLKVYEEVGIDEVFCPCNYGQPQAQTLEMMQRLAEEVMPHFRKSPVRASA
ncbi:LLM class flavin-dependent oxidoreductase [Rhodoligotrophos ferricapiens]|uniref:LLM class flavin-dependent oxidoreductase n=1 Tax=Rhodoligotrophos ferricapiens TaxID=3069264 RepID=UPI00315CBCD8